MSEGNSKLTIKLWAEDDRPREKLISKGKSALSDAELLAILIGSGNKEETALDVSKKILANNNNHLSDLAKMSIIDLMKIKGIGEAKAVSIAAALELGRRLERSSTKKENIVKSSNDAYKLLKPLMADLRHEEFCVLFLSRSNKILAQERISVGGVNSTLVDVKIIMKHALALLASSIILAHNHPSGNLNPSEADISITQKIKHAAQFFEVQLIDHIIVCEQGYFSFADENLLA